MPNGDCVVGAECKARIDNLEKADVAKKSAIDKVNTKLDSINAWLLVTVGGVAVTLLLQVINLVTKAAETIK